MSAVMAGLGVGRGWGWEHWEQLHRTRRWVGAGAEEGVGMHMQAASGAKAGVVQGVIVGVVRHKHPGAPPPKGDSQPWAEMGMCHAHHHHLPAPTLPLPAPPPHPTPLRTTPPRHTGAPPSPPVPLACTSKTTGDLGGTRGRPGPLTRPLGKARSPGMNRRLQGVWVGWGGGGWGGTTCGEPEGTDPDDHSLWALVQREPSLPTCCATWHAVRYFTISQCISSDHCPVAIYRHTGAACAREGLHRTVPESWYGSRDRRARGGACCLGRDL